MSKSIRIQIVEDELIIAMDLMSSLQSRGYTIIKIDITGEQAIQTAYNYKPDIVLMDINLKGKLNGLQAAEEIIHINIPIIFVTSQRDEETVQKMNRYSSYHVFKPYHIGVLDDKIKQVMSN